jgi:hypothetical protein
MLIFVMERFDLCSVRSKLQCHSGQRSQRGFAPLAFKANGLVSSEVAHNAYCRNAGVMQ